MVGWAWILGACAYFCRERNRLWENLKNLGRAGEGWDGLMLKIGWGLTHCMFWIVDNPKNAMRQYLVRCN